MPFDSARAPKSGPCEPWCTIDDVRACGLSEIDVDDATVTWAIGFASMLLWAASGRQYGICQRTARPCYEGDHSYGAHGHANYRRPDDYMQPGGYGYGLACSCALPMLRLPGPIADVEEIMINGVVLDPAAYGIKTSGHLARKALVRLDGDTWPCCNDITGDPTVVDPTGSESCPAWQVTWYKGRPVPEEAVGVAAALAEQFARARCGGKCAESVTAGTTRIARRGTTREYESPSKAQAMGMLADLPTWARDWVTAVNPKGLRRRTRVVRASDPEPRRLWSWA